MPDIFSCYISPFLLQLEKKNVICREREQISSFLVLELWKTERCICLPLVAIAINSDNQFIKRKGSLHLMILEGSVHSKVNYWDLSGDIPTLQKAQDTVISTNFLFPTVARRKRETQIYLTAPFENSPMNETCN